MPRKWEDMRVDEKLEFLRDQYSKLEMLAVETYSRVDDFSASKRPSLRAMENELDQMLERFSSVEARLSKLKNKMMDVPDIIARYVLPPPLGGTDRPIAV